MSLVVLTSASGSPGVTTTALGLALSWPRPVLLVEADPTGASGLLAGYFRGARYYESGLVEVALSALGVADALAQARVPLSRRPVPGRRAGRPTGRDPLSRRTPHPPGPGPVRVVRRLAGRRPLLRLDPDPLRERLRPRQARSHHRNP